MQHRNDGVLAIVIWIIGRTKNDGLRHGPNMAQFVHIQAVERRCRLMARIFRYTMTMWYNYEQNVATRIMVADDAEFVYYATNIIVC